MRIDRIIDLDVIGDEPSTDVIEWLAEHADDILAHQLDCDLDEVDAELTLDEYESLHGWVVQAATPTRDCWPGFSWGSYLTKVFFGETYDEAFEEAAAWVESLATER
ncbi:MAG: hypothetical protein M1522_04575 [Actinobacteria bacterium]|jgi:hypothetical protein|nr:hypothetical protein [Actinomycetota bacterium]